MPVFSKVVHLEPSQEYRFKITPQALKTFKVTRSSGNLKSLQR